jgi:large subunit ribosomal protein L4e
MFAPTKTWRRWHRKVNIHQKRFALVSSLAASAVPALVMARGHRIDSVPEIPLVVDNKAIDNIDKTTKAMALLKTLNVLPDIEKVKDSREIRSGKGKMRNRRYTQRRGPLVIYNQQSPLVKAFRNIPGVEVVNVTRLNLLQLAPGGHLGRFCIWTKDAFDRLENIYGTFTKESTEKEGFRLPQPLLTNADIGRIINSDEVQSALRPKQKSVRVPTIKHNALTNLTFRIKLNPYAKTERRRRLLAEEQRLKKKAELVDAKRKGIVTKDPKRAKKKGIRKFVAKNHKKFYDVLLK